MENVHNISIIGSTGSIGTQTLEVVDDYDNLKVWGISAYSDIDTLEKQIRKYKPKLACVVKEDRARELKIRVADTNTKIISSEAGLGEISTMNEVETVVTAVVGISGLLPTINAINEKKNIALANKETLVTGGHIVTKLAKEKNVKILPVDSEHSAIFQSLQGFSKDDVKRIILTASGGPFLNKTKKDLEKVTVEQALKHPNWDMGAKITIDSSTLVNKGLEVIEAKWLFGVDASKIKVLVHKQSVIHSMVEYNDNGIIAQLGTPDMKLPIQYALTYPKRLKMTTNELDFTKYQNLTFEEPDTDTFYALKLAYKAAEIGGSLPTVFNSADEAAVELFLKKKIGYLDITRLISEAMDEIEVISEPTLEQILEIDKLSRELVYKKV